VILIILVRVLNLFQLNKFEWKIIGGRVECLWEELGKGREMTAWGQATELTVIM